VTSLNAVASIVLNIAPDHMDRHQDMEAYIRAKDRIYSGNGSMVVNLDDGIVADLRREHRNCIGITLSEPMHDHYGIRRYHAERWIVRGDKKLLAVEDIPLRGEHNMTNVMASMALAQAVDCPWSAIRQVVCEFQGLAHRCQLVAEQSDIVWINDSKSTNVAASCAAIESVSNKQNNIILIAGGDGKKADFSPLRRFAKDDLKAVLVLGKDGGRIADTFAHLIPVYGVDAIDAAVATAAQLANVGDTVLLSPACSSHDMFVDYQERGSAFVRAIKKHLGREQDV
jgi:UDP-N-acetylmuramoylalanine--D-glutamate ligase